MISAEVKDLRAQCGGVAESFQSHWGEEKRKRKKTVSEIEWEIPVPLRVGPRRRKLQERRKKNKLRKCPGDYRLQKHGRKYKASDKKPQKTKQTFCFDER